MAKNKKQNDELRKNNKKAKVKAEKLQYQNEDLQNNVVSTSQKKRDVLSRGRTDDPRSGVVLFSSTKSRMRAAQCGMRAARCGMRAARCRMRAKVSPCRETVFPYFCCMPSTAAFRIEKRIAGYSTDSRAIRALVF